MQKTHSKQERAMSRQNTKADDYNAKVEAENWQLRAQLAESQEKCNFLVSQYEHLLNAFTKVDFERNQLKKDKDGLVEQIGQLQLQLQAQLLQLQFYAQTTQMVPMMVPMVTTINPCLSPQSMFPIQQTLQQQALGAEHRAQTNTHHYGKKPR